MIFMILNAVILKSNAFMKFIDSELDHLTDAEIQERLQHFWKYVKINICHLVLKNNNIFDSQSNSDTNAVHLLKLFQKIDCFCLKLKHHISVIISKNVLKKIILFFQIIQIKFFSHIDFLQLCFDHDTHISYLTKKSCLKTTENYFSSDEKWWIIDLYFDCQFLF